MKVTADCLFCGATNTEKNVRAWGGDDQFNAPPLGPFVFKCWRCLKWFSFYDGKAGPLPGWMQPLGPD